MRGCSDISFERFQAQLAKIEEETAEVRQAVKEPPETWELDTMIELLDVIHAAETALRMVAEESSRTGDGYTPLLDEAFERVISKNAERGYYANAEGWV